MHFILVLTELLPKASKLLICTMAVDTKRNDMDPPESEDRSSRPDQRRVSEKSKIQGFAATA